VSTIAATVIRRPRRSYRCSLCGLSCGAGPHVRTYGRADRDPPYVLRLCLACADVCHDRVVEAALATWRATDRP
jgi:hypothetical protein